MDYHHEYYASLTLTINNSLMTGEVLEECKIANVIPIFKKGNRQEAQNYRLMFLMGEMCKLLYW